MLTCGLCVCVCVCVQEGAFERRSMEPIDHFDADYPPEKMVGTCNACNKENIQVTHTNATFSLLTSLPPSLSLSLQPNISFQCVSCDTRDMAILRQIRDNIHDIPCMKCTLRK